MSDETIGPLRHSAEIDQIAAALAGAQAAYPPIAKERVATVRPRDKPEYRYLYATLGDVWNQVRASLGAHGLAVIAAPATVSRGQGPTLIATTTRLLHASGQWFELDVLMAGGLSANEVATAVTYGRKLGFSCLLGIAPDDDPVDPGASPPKQPPQAPPTRQSGPSSKARPPRQAPADPQRAGGREALEGVQARLEQNRRALVAQARRLTEAGLGDQVEAIARRHHESGDVARVDGSKHKALRADLLELERTLEKESP